MAARKLRRTREEAPPSRTQVRNLARLCDRIPLVRMTVANQRQVVRNLVTLLHFIKYSGPGLIFAQIRRISEYVETMFGPGECNIDSVGALRVK